MTTPAKYVSIALALLSLFGSASSGAIAQIDHDQHHPQAAPAQDTQTEPSPADKGANTSGTPKGGMMGGGMMGMMQGCPMMGMMGPGGPETRVKGRIAFLKAELAITDEQKEKWDAYAAAVQKNLESVQSMRHSKMKMMEARSPVQRLDQHIAAMEARTAALKEVKPALTDLYAALSDDQKKTADELLIGMGCLM
ncbi:Spy/CpxP family protein refolding chaperone [Hyphomicrobium sp. CS1GBMeth3]|uniref:Spy/CpxP family protein refolding chaperone n=1 Tax=Hyphomicrobium sp. CS1GBMeth3 TaxID=1892845 RepID=UPI0009311832|nr:Spy/CpxP family protein refolding chaperone [Hyphomicrobium sp. CS1GBMeth3]